MHFRSAVLGIWSLWYPNHQMSSIKQMYLAWKILLTHPHFGGVIKSCFLLIQAFLSLNKWFNFSILVLIEKWQKVLVHTLARSFQSASDSDLSPLLSQRERVLSLLFNIFNCSLRKSSFFSAKIVLSICLMAKSITWSKISHPSQGYISADSEFDRLTVLECACWGMFFCWSAHPDMMYGKQENHGIFLDIWRRGRRIVSEIG